MPLESISTASSALRSGATARVLSRWSRSRSSARVSAGSTVRPAARSSMTRRRARSSAVAVRKNFAAGAGEHHRADVAALDHHPARRAQPPLQVEQRRAHLGQRRDPGRAVGDLGRADVACEMSAPRRKTWLVPSSPSTTKANEISSALGQARHARTVAPVDPLAACQQRERPVDGSGVEQRVAEALGEHLGGGRLAGAGGTIDCDHQSGRVLTHSRGTLPRAGETTRAHRPAAARIAVKWRGPASNMRHGLLSY